MAKTVTKTLEAEPTLISFDVDTKQLTVEWKLTIKENGLLVSSTPQSPINVLDEMTPAQRTTVQNIMAAIVTAFKNKYPL